MISHLREIDKHTKPDQFDHELILANDYYHDCSRVHTIQRLAELGVGLSGNKYPLQVSLLRRIIDRLAVIYDQPPTRWLTRNSKTVSESSTAHRNMIQALEHAQYDLAWRRIDKLRALFRQVVVRYYPSDAQGSVVCRIFEPYNVIRQPSEYAPDCMDEDRQFALLLSGDPEVACVWEHWEKQDQQWFVRWVDHKGIELPDHPFRMVDGVSPYSELPVQIIYDEYTGGSPWLSPRVSRTAWTSAINAIANDLWGLITYEAHSEIVLKTDDPNEPPHVTGPGKIQQLRTDSDMQILARNPKIAESLEVLEGLIRFWTISEDLPGNEFDKSKQVVTGAALKVQMAPLVSRREAQIPLAVRDEKIAFRKFRAVHNLHTSPDWYVPALDENTELMVELGDGSPPTDMREFQDASAKSIALGTASVIDVIQRERNVTRPQAIEIYERVQKDLEEYPVPSIPVPIEQKGPKMTDTTQAKQEDGTLDNESRNESTPIDKPTSESV